MNDDRSAFDVVEALHRAMGDAGFLKRMAIEFKTTLPGFIAVIAAAVREDRLADAGRQAHQLKGAAANLGAKAMAAAFLDLESIGQADRGGSEAPAALRRLETAVEDFNRALAAVDWNALER